MLNIYIYKKLDNVPHIPILNFIFGRDNFGVKRISDEALNLLNNPCFALVDEPEKADYFLMPHNYFFINSKEYVDFFIDLSKKYNKKIIVFSYGDSDAEINVPNSIVFRSSQYKYKLKDNEIIMPAPADDLLPSTKVAFRKKSPKPTVGFCGWASYKSFSRMVVENVKLIPIYVKGKFINKNYYFHKRGLLFRIDAIKYLRNSSLILPNFILRKSYSGSEKTRNGSVEKVRLEYVKNILESDFSLAVKGDGNFSVRFYEILSLGRIPLFLDTNCVLPLEDMINYGEFMLKVDYKDIKNIDKIVSDFYSKTSNEDFISMQKKAREVFEKYLRIDSFFQHVFTENFLDQYLNK